MTRPMLAVALALVSACAGQTWPEPPVIDQAAYQKQYDEWRAGQQETAEFALRVSGIVAVPQGDTPFGDAAGVLTRIGEQVTVTPAAAAALTYDGSGAPVTPKSALALYETTLVQGAKRFQLVDMGEESPKRLFLMTTDVANPATVAPIATYPVDPRWRVTARFAAYESARRMLVPDVRGGQVPLTAVGTLTFRLRPRATGSGGHAEEREQQLIVFGEPGASQLATLFKDPTNETTTYRGYRIVRAERNGEWAVLDFNQAGNPPCAYSPYTTCPLPPPGNRLDVAIEAGEKRHPDSKSS